jgi:hypothetical protein
VTTVTTIDERTHQECNDHNDALADGLNDVGDGVHDTSFQWGFIISHVILAAKMKGLVVSKSSHFDGSTC